MKLLQNKKILIMVCVILVITCMINTGQIVANAEEEYDIYGSSDEILEALTRITKLKEIEEVIDISNLKINTKRVGAGILGVERITISDNGYVLTDNRNISGNLYNSEGDFVLGIKTNVTRGTMFLTKDNYVLVDVLVNGKNYVFKVSQCGKLMSVYEGKSLKLPFFIKKIIKYQGKSYELDNLLGSYSLHITNEDGHREYLEFGWSKFIIQTIAALLIIYLVVRYFAKNESFSKNE